MINLSDIPTEELAAEIGRRADAQTMELPSSPQDGEILSITRKVAGVFGVPMEDILSQSRKADLAEARFAAWMILRDRGFIPSQIAPVFWRNDTGTIRHGCNRGRELIQINKRFARKLKTALDLVAQPINRPCHQCVGVGKIQRVLPEPAGEFECNACNGSGVATKPKRDAA